MIKYFIEEINIDINETDNEGNTCIVYINNDIEKIFQYLIQEQHININHNYYNYGTIMHHMCHNYNQTIMKLLLDNKNIDINIEYF